jgi:hypothetical protein
MHSTYEQSELDYVSGNIVTNIHHAAMLGVDRVYPEGLEMGSIENILAKGKYSHNFTPEEVQRIHTEANRIKRLNRGRVRGHNERYASKISEVQMAIDLMRVNQKLKKWAEEYELEFVPKLYFYIGNGIMDVAVHENKSKGIRKLMIFKKYEPGRTAFLTLSRIRNEVSVYNFNENALEAVVMAIIKKDTFNKNSYRMIRHQTYYGHQRDHQAIIARIKENSLIKDEPAGFARFISGQTEG